MSEWVAICAVEGEEPVEVQTENDGTMLMSSVAAQFPKTTGLKYRNPETNTLRGVRCQEEALLPPTEEGWGALTYICVTPKPEAPKKNELLKRKKMDEAEMSSKNIKVADEEDAEEEEEDPDKTIDLILLGLAWKTTEEDIEEFFEPFGEVAMVDLKKKPNGESKGFGFIKFVDKAVEKRVLMQRHMIANRWVELKIPESAEGKGRAKTSCKVFVGGVTEAHTVDDLKEHFATFGEVTDIYMPVPCKHYAFVTFSEVRVAKSLLGKEHVVKGVNLKIGEAIPRNEPGHGRDRDRRGGGRFDNRGNQGYGGYGGQSPGHPGYGNQSYGNQSPNWNSQPAYTGMGGFGGGGGGGGGYGGRRY